MRRPIAAARACVLSSMLVSCSASSGGDSPFDSPTVGMPGNGSAPPSGDDGDDDDGDESSTGDPSTDDGDQGSTGSDMDPGAGTLDAASTGLPDDMPTDGGSDTGGVGPMQTGMYADCLVPEDCVAPTNVCIVVNMTAGFCTNMACSNPATDCEPAPGGTAVPTCFPIELNGTPTASCALSCANGEVCPAGMTCWPLAEGSICA